MSIWSTRNQSEKALSKSLSTEAIAIEQGFILLDNLITQFESKSCELYCRVCGLVLLKAKNLCLAIFSLSLDGLAQEAGALLRPAIECFELLDYFYADPERVQQAIDEELPLAGVIAKKINGKHQRLRKFLNRTASHFSLSADSLKHLIDLRKGKLHLTQPYLAKVLSANLWTLFCIMVIVTTSASICLSLKNLLPDQLASQIQDWQIAGLPHAEKLLGEL